MRSLAAVDAAALAAEPVLRAEEVEAVAKWMEMAVASRDLSSAEIRTYKKAMTAKGMTYKVTNKARTYSSIRSCKKNKTEIKIGQVRTIGIF